MLFIFLLLPATVSAAIVPNGIQPYQHMLTWTVRNDNLWPLLFYYLNPCLMEHGICVRHNNGPCLDYEGIHANVAEGWDYEPLWPFQSYSCSFNVTQTFDMEKAGIYSIQFRGSRRSETETQLTTTLSFGDYNSEPRSTFYSCEQYFSPVPTSPSNIIYMRKGTDDEIRISSEKEKEDKKRLLSDDDESDHGF